MNRDWDEHSLLTPKETADIFRINTVTLANWRRSGRIIGYPTPSGHHRYRRDDVEAMLRGEPSPSHIERGLVK